MTRRLTLGAVLCFVLTAVLVTATAYAHPMTYQGTVLTVQPTKIQVKTVDPMTKKDESIWFIVDKNTKVKRGEKGTTFSDAKITTGERVVITVDMDAETKNLAEEIRLAEKK